MKRAFIRNTADMDLIPSGTTITGCTSLNEQGTSASNTATSRADATPPPPHQPSINRVLPRMLNSNEREFFRSFGVDAFVDGKPGFRAADLSRWPAIMNASDANVRTKMAKISEACTNREAQQKYEPEFQAAYEKARFTIGARIMLSLFENNDLKSAISASNDIMRELNVVGLWRSQREFIEKGLPAHRSADRAQDGLLTIITQRVGQASAPSNLRARLAGSKG